MLRNISPRGPPKASSRIYTAPSEVVTSYDPEAIRFLGDVFSPVFTANSSFSTIYFLSKIFASDGLSYVEAVSTMTDLTVDQYKQMMLDGGRNVEGWRSKKERGEN
jgi:hypothetical protein